GAPAVRVENSRADRDGTRIVRVTNSSVLAGQAALHVDVQHPQTTQFQVRAANSVLASLPGNQEPMVQIDGQRGDSDSAPKLVWHAVHCIYASWPALVKQSAAGKLDLFINTLKQWNDPLPGARNVAIEAKVVVDLAGDFVLQPYPR